MKKMEQEIIDAEGVKKITEISRLMSEAPKINFNVNVFRHGVNFDMPENEIRQDVNAI